MIQILPFPLQILLLAVVGGIVGSAINYGIYQWTYFLKRPFSPWQTPDPKASTRTWLDRVPILGWLRLRRDRAVFGNWFWIRPCLIELVWVIGCPWFYFWQQQGGLTGGMLSPLPANWSGIAEVWFWSHSVLLALLFIATFIDFDERTIPDAITVPGTLFALLVAVIFPASVLPEISANLAGQTMNPISFANGAKQTLLGLEPKSFAEGVQWHQSWVGLTVALAVFWGWVIALMPKICTLRYGIIKGLRIMVLSCLRPKRKTVCAVRTVERKPYLVTILLFGLGVLGTIAIVAAKVSSLTANWNSLFQALFGMGFGGSIIWGIRIVGRLALQKEAMGFGDVTLMAMIGAFLGWQATLLTIPYAVVAALMVTIVLCVFTRDSQLAFGPYLCLGCAMVLFGWHSIWPASAMYFSLGEWLFYMLAFMLAMMLGMLSCLQLIKRAMGKA